MFAYRKNPNANPNNAFQGKELDGLCCGDVEKAILCKYVLVLDISSVTTANQVSIDGQVIGFGSFIDLTTEVGREAFKKALELAATKAGLTAGGVRLELDGNDLTITTDISQATWDYVNAAGNAFAKTACEVRGNFGALVCAADAWDTVEGSFLFLGVISTEITENVLINDGSSDVFNGDLVLDAGTPANATSFDGGVYFTLATYAGATTTFTITVSSKGCDDIVVTLEVTLP